MCSGCSWYISPHRLISPPVNHNPANSMNSHVHILTGGLSRGERFVLSGPNWLSGTLIYIIFYLYVPHCVWLSGHWFPNQILDAHTQELKMYDLFDSKTTSPVFYMSQCKWQIFHAHSAITGNLAWCSDSWSTQDALFQHWNKQLCII